MNLVLIIALQLYLVSGRIFRQIRAGKNYLHEFERVGILRMETFLCELRIVILC